jgi:hypothetical protein
MGDRGGLCTVLVKKPEESTWEDNIKLGLKEISLEGTGWIYVVQDKDVWRAVVNAVMNRQIL